MKKGGESPLCSLLIKTAYNELELRLQLRGMFGEKAAVCLLAHAQRHSFLAWHDMHVKVRHFLPCGSAA